MDMLSALPIGSTAGRGTSDVDRTLDGTTLNRGCDIGNDSGSYASTARLSRYCRMLRLDSGRVSRGMVSE